MIQFGVHSNFFVVLIYFISNESELGMGVIFYASFEMHLGILLDWRNEFIYKTCVYTFRTPLRIRAEIDEWHPLKLLKISTTAAAWKFVLSLFHWVSALNG